ncbi:hypothetical protein D3C80_995830 [compost metagenome]
MNDQQFLAATADIQFAIGEEADIARRVPSVLQGLGRCFRVAIIAGEQAYAAHHDVPGRRAVRGGGPRHPPVCAVDGDLQPADGAAVADVGAALGGAQPHALVPVQLIAVDPADGRRGAQPRLGDGEHGLGHGVAGLDGGGRHAAVGEGLGELDEGFFLAGLGAGDEGPHRGQVVGRPGRPQPRDVIEGEVGHPTQRAAVALDRLQQHGGSGHPLESVQRYNRRAPRHRDQEAREQPHVVIERKPADHDIGRLKVDGPGVALRLDADLAKGEHDALLQPCGARAVLEQGHLIGQGRDPGLTRLEIGDPAHIRHLRFQTLQRLAQGGDIVGIGQDQARIDATEQLPVTRPVEISVLLGRGEGQEGRRQTGVHRSQEGGIELRLMTQNDEDHRAGRQSEIAEQGGGPQGLGASLGIGLGSRLTPSDEVDANLVAALNGVTIQSFEEGGRNQHRHLGYTLEKFLHDLASENSAAIGVGRSIAVRNT